MPRVGDPHQFRRTRGTLPPRSLSPADPLPIAAVSLFLPTVAILACLLPAHCATRLHPYGDFVEQHIFAPLEMRNTA